MLYLRNSVVVLVLFIFDFVLLFKVRLVALCVVFAVFFWVGGLVLFVWFITFCCLIIVRLCLVCALNVFVFYGVGSGFGLGFVFG